MFLLLSSCCLRCDFCCVILYGLFAGVLCCVMCWGAFVFAVCFAVCLVIAGVVGWCFAVVVDVVVCYAGAGL